jgi:hypothetical protein
MNTEAGIAKDRLTVTLRVPITYLAYGYAEVQVPLNASDEDIQEACEDLQPSDLKDGDVLVRGNGGPQETHCRHCQDEPWQVHLPKHLWMLGNIGDAFVSLEERSNILTFAHECCTSDSACYGHDALNEHPRYIGFAYIHAQNVDNILEDGVCHIGFSSREDTPESHKAIADAIMEALREQGLTAAWDGSIDNKIEVTR